MASSAANRQQDVREFSGNLIVSGSESGQPLFYELLCSNVVFFWVLLLFFCVV